MYDFVIVGYGPVGMVAAALLGQAGHRVIVVERHATLYNLPRAAAFDQEVARLLQKLGCVEDVLQDALPQAIYEWCNGQGELLLEFEAKPRGSQGWAEAYQMYQPVLEDALDATVKAMANVTVRQGWAVTGLRHTDAGVEIDAEDARTGDAETVEGRWLLACDGGNSFVRSALGIGSADLGFQERWLVCDLVMKRPVDLPLSRQLCDPEQPGVMVQLGHHHRRWSFMILPGESEEEAVHPDNVWKRIGRWVTPDDLDLIRSVNYTFKSLIAERWRDGRCFLVGDAAHQMPPFLGQGMCSGLRDAHNLAWKLDLVVRGLADDSLLDTYQVEREPHVRAITLRSIELGKIQTMRDPEAAARRDQELLARRKESDAPAGTLEYPGIGDGFLAHDPAGGPAPGAGELFPQGAVAGGGRTGRFDDVVGPGFVLLGRKDPGGTLGPEHRRFWERIGGRTVALGGGPGPDGSTVLISDAEGTYHSWLEARECEAVVVRPDFYVFGAARTAPDVPAMLDQLQQAITSRDN